MKITSIGLFANGFEVANFNFRDPRSLNPYVIQGITGIDADEIVPKFGGFSTTSKAKQYEMALNKRDIAMLIALVPKVGLNKSHSDLRDDLYRAVASCRSGQVQLRFNNGSAVVAVMTGFIVKFESSLSTKTPQVQITIKCAETLFKSMEPRYVDADSLGKEFTITDAVSTAPHGITFEVAFTSETFEFTLTDRLDGRPEWFFTVVPGTVFGGSSFKDGDSLIISSEHDNKQVYATRGSTVEQLADRIVVGSLWPRIFPGNNDFFIEVGAGSFTWTSVYYWSTYWGL